MLDFFEIVCKPALHLFKRYSLIMFAPVMSIFLGLAVVTNLVANDSLRFPILGILALFTGYLLIGFFYYRRRHLKISAALMDRALAGDWKFSMADVPTGWEQQGTVPMVLNYTNRIKTLTDETAQLAEGLLDNSKATALDAAKLLMQAEEIAAMLEETAAGLEQFTSSIEKNAQSCREVKDLAEQSTQAAYAGAHEVSAINNAVDQISERSNRVLDILDLIESFAEQTNMLALSAAIEAARAGQQGKGFTQVSDEVRELSGKSSEAAKIIRQRIESASVQMREGVKTAKGSNKILEDMLLQVAQTQELIDDIASSSSEQSEGVTQIKAAVEQMADLTQHNASSVEQVAKLANALQKEAFSLDKNLDALKASRFNSKEACVALVKRAKHLVKTEGVASASARFNSKSGGYHDRDLFIVMTDMNGEVFAHGGEPTIVGTNSFGLIDAKGYAYVKALVKLAAEPGQGWVKYQVRNPATGRPALKNTYMERVEGTGFWVCSGIFSELKINERSELAVPV